MRISTVTGLSLLILVVGSSGALSADAGAAVVTTGQQAHGVVRRAEQQVRHGSTRLALSGAILAADRAFKNLETNRFEERPPET